ncbi:unnamed protein product [Adineta steineri]|uniref:Uncharacterized protein n=1 Tax=Adineta steineri TaxID=433720 RepID=A0A814GG46_9BILA|nr:unnamed protein product [Adineta steineri]
MLRRSQNKSNKKRANKTSASRTGRSTQLNMNACDQRSMNTTSRLELLGKLMIDQLKGSERDHLKEQLSLSGVSSSSRRSLKQLFTDFYTFNERQCHTIGIDNHETNTNQIDVPVNESQISMTIKRKTRQQTTDNKTKKTPTIITRTICTRSSKLNSLNNNEEQINHVLPNRTRKRRSSLINNNINESEINNGDKRIVDNTKEISSTNSHKILGGDVSGVKVSRKKLQSSVPSPLTIECSKPTNDF